MLDARKPLTVLCVFDERVKSDVSDLSFVRSLMFLVPAREQARHSVAHDQPCYPPSRTPLYSPHLHCSHSATAGQLFTFVPSPEAQQSAISRLYHRPPPERRPLERRSTVQPPTCASESAMGDGAHLPSFFAFLAAFFFAFFFFAAISLSFACHVARDGRYARRQAKKQNKQAARSTQHAGRGGVESRGRPRGPSSSG